MGRFEGMVFYSGIKGKSELDFNSDDLVNLCYKVDYLGDCYSVVTDQNGRSMVVNCPARVITPSSRDNVNGPVTLPDNGVTLASLASPSA